MNMVERVAKLKAVANDLNIKLYAIGVTPDKNDDFLATSTLGTVLGIDTVIGSGPAQYFYSASDYKRGMISKETMHKLIGPSEPRPEGSGNSARVRKVNSRNAFRHELHNKVNTV